MAGHYISDGTSAYVAGLDSLGNCKWGFLSRNVDLSSTLLGGYTYGVTCAVYNNSLLMGGNFLSDTVYLGNFKLTNATYTYFYQGFYGYANSSDIYLLKLIKSNGIDELASDEFRIYPNPAKNEVFIAKGDHFNKIERVILTGVDGKSIYLWDNIDDCIILPGNIQDGIYILIIQTKENTISRKLIIKK